MTAKTTSMRRVARPQDSEIAAMQGGSASRVPGPVELANHVVAVDASLDMRTGEPPFDHLSQAGGDSLLRGMIARGLGLR